MNQLTMLRRLLLQQRGIQRRCLVTSSQKRALKEEQVAGAPVAATSASAGGSNLAPFAVVAAVVAGGATYYYYGQGANDTSSTVSSAVAAESKPKPEKLPKESKSDSTAESSPLTIKSTSASKESKEETSANRVVSINVPSKMKNSSTTQVPGVTHPEHGSRVAMAPAKDDTSTTESAVEDLQSSTTEAAAQALIESHATLRTKLDKTLFADLDDLTPGQLKARIIQLATELQDRTQWEAIRLKEFMNLKERETTDKYMELMQKQRLEFEELLSKRLMEKDREMTAQMYATLQEKDNAIQKVVQTALETQQNEHEEDKKAFEEIITAEISSSLDEKYGQEMEEYKAKTAEALQQKVSALQELTTKMQSLETILEASKTSKEGSLKAHRLSAAALALSSKLETHDPAASELDALKIAAGNEGVIATACATIPNAVRTGIPTVAELQTKFGNILSKARQAALVPEGRPGLEGQLAGMVLASVKYAPSLTDHDESDETPEVVLVRAQEFVANGELETAIAQLDKLKGQVGYTVKDWVKEALNRVAVEKALKVIKMECALLNESCLVE